MSMVLNCIVLGTDIVDLAPDPKTPVTAKYTLPEKYAGKAVFEITSNDFNSLKELRPYGTELVEDKEAANGKAMAMRNPKKESPEKFFNQDFVMGIQGRTSKKGLAYLRLWKAKNPVDEKYHLYSLGKITLEPKTLFFGHRTWQIQQDLSDWYNAKEPAKNRVEVLVSVKLTGSAYVKDSKSPNGIYIDRIILIP